jgi:hypothetical protein
MNKEDFVKTGIGVIITTILALAFSELSKNISKQFIFLSLFIVFSIFTSTLGLIAYFKAEKQLLKIKKCVGELQLARKVYDQESVHKKLKWLIHDNELLNIEKDKKKSKEIWIVSPDPTDDTGNSPWVQVIKQNITDGITYIYVTPDKPSLNGAIKGLKSVFRGRLNQCKILKLNHEEYKKLPFSHLVIYDPNNTHDEFDCLAELEVEESGWWIRISVRKLNELIGIIDPYIAKSSYLENL